MSDKKYYQTGDTFQQEHYVPQQQSTKNNNHNDYLTALHELQRPHRPSRTERLFGVANEIKTGLHNAKTMDSGQHKEQVGNVSATLDNVRRQVLNTDYKQQRRDYRSKERSLKKLAKLEEKRLKALRKQEDKTAKKTGRHEVACDSNANATVLPPSHNPTNNSRLPEHHFNSPYISPTASPSSSRCHNESDTALDHHHRDFNEPPPPYDG